MDSLEAQLQRAGGGDGDVPVPLMAAFERDATFMASEPFTAIQLPAWRSLFKHAAARLPVDTAPTPQQLTAAYEALLMACSIAPLREGIDRTQDASFPSHNLAISRRWMLLVPRARDPAPATGVGVNGAGLLGFLLVRNDDALAAVSDAGPSSVLADVGLGA